MSPTIRKLEEKIKGFTLSQMSFFILGYTVWMDDSSFPFASEEERHNLWKQCKGYLQQQMNQPRIHGDFRAPRWNNFRPAEYWASGDALEPLRLFADGAIEETHYEFLSRLNLLTPEDEKFIRTYSKQFWEEENSDREYREFYFEEEKKDEERKQSSPQNGLELPPREVLSDFPLRIEPEPEETPTVGVLPTKEIQIPQPKFCPICNGQLSKLNAHDWWCKNCYSI